MKKLTSWQNKTFLKIWILYHAVAAVFFAAVFSIRGVKIDADLFNMLPKPVMGKALNAADEKLTEMTAQNVFILVANEDFDAAKSAAEKVYSELKDSSKFKSISLYQDDSSFGEILSYIQKYRWNILDEKTVQNLNTPGGPEVFSENALALAYSGFTITSLENLETDPFMLGETGLQNYMDYLQKSGTSMSLKDGVLASYKQPEGVSGVDKPYWYIMIRGVLSKEGAALASSSNAVVEIHKVCDPLEKDGTHFVYSGTPFHSYKSSSNASREISIISSVSMLVVLIILLMIFKRPQPIILSVMSILLSSVTAIMTTLAIFGKMHVLTLVFGTSLIGSCIDYSLHYFINWKSNTDCKTGSDVRAHLLKGLGLSLISTLLCYLVLVFAPFNLLKQMAVFSISGILSTFLSVICIYPYVPVPQTGKDIYLLRFVKTPDWYNKKFVGRIVVTGMFVVSIGGLLIFNKSFKIENNLAKLYKMEGREFQNEAEASQVLKYSPSAWYIVSGETVEEVLQNEEKVTAKLKVINEGKEKGGYIATSAFIPSKKKQQESRDAAAKLLPLSEMQYEYLGYDSSLSASLKNAFEASNEDFIEMGKNVPAFIETSISSAWIGEIDGKYYSVVMPVSVTDYDAYKALGDNESIFFISKVRSMNEDLDKLSRMILILFVVVYVLIFIVLKFFYSLKQALKIVSVPLLIILFIAAIFAAAKINLEFFSITGMILVFGLGLDYVIYMIENEKRHFIQETENSKLEQFAIGLSFVTTAVSFGALALSSFVPVHMIGLSIFIGLAVAYVTTFFYARVKF